MSRLAFFRLLYICRDLLSEALTFIPLMACSQASLAAEILFLRKQLAFYQERKIKPHRFDDAARLSMVLFSKLFEGIRRYIDQSTSPTSGSTRMNILTVVCCRKHADEESNMN
jgi:hypothetical protein